MLEKRKEKHSEIMLIFKVMSSAFNPLFMLLIFSLFRTAMLAVDGNNVFQASTQEYWPVVDQCTSSI